LVVEGPKAGGHLGFKEAELGNDFENELIRIIELIRTYEQKYKKDIPVIFGGGIFNNQDVKHYLSLGCSGIQVGTRFVATHECDAHINFKMAYVNAKKEDVIIVKSPVGLPGRALKNKFTQSISSKATIRKCYNCLIPCNPKNTIYCISQALIAAAKGDVDNGLVFCGENVHRIDKITSVKEVISEFLEE
jgi:NAD(P)H-dependent flavin oxidoreductase YrpB (nitropropane dioxygenase family)